MTDYIEFSQKIKEKYPQYKDIDDLTLAQKMVENTLNIKKQLLLRKHKNHKRKI